MREREEGTPKKTLTRGWNSTITHSITGLGARLLITTVHQPTPWHTQHRLSSDHTRESQLFAMSQLAMITSWFHSYVCSSHHIHIGLNFVEKLWASCTLQYCSGNVAWWHRWIRFCKAHPKGVTFIAMKTLSSDTTRSWNDRKWYFSWTSHRQLPCSSLFKTVMWPPNNDNHSLINFSESLLTPFQNVLCPVHWCIENCQCSCDWWNL